MKHNLLVSWWQEIDRESLREARAMVLLVLARVGPLCRLQILGSGSPVNRFVAHFPFSKKRE